jgi:antitoxin component of RelBE/YafQ-DinJ toxin-antitoxin module
MKLRVSLSIDEQTYKKFQEYCEQNGMKMSSKIELFIKDFLKKN